MIFDFFSLSLSLLLILAVQAFSFFPLSLLPFLEASRVREGYRKNPQNLYLTGLYLYPLFVCIFIRISYCLFGLALFLILISDI